MYDALINSGLTALAAVGGGCVLRGTGLSVSSGVRHSLVFVPYPDDHTVHEEWVYNPDGLVSARVIFAYDLGNSRNPELIALYPDRAVWLVEVSNQVRLEPYVVGR